MALIEVAHERMLTDAEIQAIIARATNTINVLQQLGATYQDLPGYKMTDYQTETDALEAKLQQLQALVDQIKPILIDLDGKSGPLFEKNKGALPMLRGMLAGKAEEDLLVQITGPQPQAVSGVTVPPPTT